MDILVDITSNKVISKFDINSKTPKPHIRHFAKKKKKTWTVLLNGPQAYVVRCVTADI